MLLLSLIAVTAGRTGPLRFCVAMVGPGPQEARNLVEQVVGQVQGMLPEGLELVATIARYEPGDERALAGRPRERLAVLPSRSAAHAARDEQRRRLSARPIRRRRAQLIGAPPCVGRRCWSRAALYLWRRPHDVRRRARGRRRALRVGAGGRGCARARSPAATPAGPSPVTLSEARVLACHDKGPRRRRPSSAITSPPSSRRSSARSRRRRRAARRRLRAERSSTWPT